jgi:hypothetical protein
MLDRGRPLSLWGLWWNAIQLLGGTMETAASFEARYAPSSHPTPKLQRLRGRAAIALKQSLQVTGDVASSLGGPWRISDNRVHTIATAVRLLG